MLRFAIALGTAFLLAPGAASAEDCATPRLLNSLPMEPAGTHGEAVVPITLNGVEKKFLLDSGGGMANYISPAVAQELKLTQFPSREAMDLHGNASRSAVVVDHVRFGTVEASHVYFQVSPNLSYDGLLSVGALTIQDPRARRWALMDHVDVDMDFGAMRLNLFSVDHCGGGVVYWPHQSLAIVPVRMVEGHIEFPAALDGHEIQAAIDTGASWTNLDKDWAQDHVGFSPDGPQSAVAKDAGLPKDDPGHQVYFRSYSTLSFEGIAIENPLVVVRSLKFSGWNDPVSLASRARHLFDDINRHDPDIIIGMEVLRHLHLYYAAGEHKLYITPVMTLPVAEQAPPK